MDFTIHQVFGRNAAARTASSKEMFKDPSNHSAGLKNASAAKGPGVCEQCSGGPTEALQLHGHMGFRHLSRYPHSSLAGYCLLSNQTVVQLHRCLCIPMFWVLQEEKLETVSNTVFRRLPKERVYCTLPNPSQPPQREGTA